MSSSRKSFVNSFNSNSEESNQNRKKILIGVVVPSLESSGGVQSIAEMLIKQIECSELYDYLLISLATSASDDCSSRIRKPLSLFDGPIAKNREWRGRKMIHIGCSMAEFEFMRYRKRSILKSTLSQCDLIQVVGGFPAWGASVLDCGKPLAVWAATRCMWERGRLLKVNNGLITYWRRLMTVFLNRLDDLVIRKSGAVMVMNPVMREYVELKLAASGSVVYAPPCVDTSWLCPKSKRIVGDIASEDSYILSVGRLDDPRKNPELLLEAYKLLTEKLAICPKLIFAGATGPADGFWKKVVNYGLSGRVAFCEEPDCEQLKKLYQGALCFALSSDEEGFGMVIVEAMACGIPVVSTRCGGPDGIISNGEDGCLVEVGDATALTDRLYLLCSDMNFNRRMGLKAREAVLSRFSEQFTRNIFFDTWNKLLAM
jgi:glycosyltransferase involved in cell wall biosynthesis